MEFYQDKCICGTVKVSSKGQIVIPKKARDYYDFKEEDTLFVIAEKDVGITLIKADNIDELKKKL